MQDTLLPSHRQGSRAPSARVDDLVMTEIDDHLLIYDTIRHHIHDLNRCAATVWRLCDGRLQVADIRRAASMEMGEELDLKTIREALTLLEDKHLLAAALDPADRVARTSRRQFLKSGRRAAMAALVAPAIVSISAPSAASAASTDNCIPYNQTCYKLDRNCCAGLECKASDIWNPGYCW